MSERYMPSIFPQCDKLKQAYDKCFTNFFQHYVSADYQHINAENPCSKLHDIYRDCVQKNLAEHRPYEIDIDELKKEVTVKDSFFKNEQKQS